MDKIIYISQGYLPVDHIEHIKKACNAGCKNIQLRLKHTELPEWLATAYKAKELCDTFGAKLFINDAPQIAATVNAYGIHVGKEDMPLAKVKQDFKPFVTGATANTIEDIQRHAVHQPDYIGLGPLRFTETKQKLSPILGLEGYRSILQKMQLHGIQIPVFAIGGIGLEDIPGLMKAGVYGIAVSGLITRSAQAEKIVTQLQQLLHHEYTTT